MDVHLLSVPGPGPSASSSSSSEMMSDFDVENEEELRSRFLSEERVYGEAGSPRRPRLCWCLRMYSRCCFRFYALDSAQKLLLLLAVLALSMLLSFVLFAAFNVHFGGATDSYLETMSLWLTTCVLAKMWLKSVGKQLDITRLEVQCASNGRTSSPRSRSLRIQQLREWTAKRTVTASADYQSIAAEEEVNAMRFEMSFEIAVEILLKATYYAFYAKYSLLVRRPTLSHFACFHAVHCLLIFAIYHIRILPAYYHGTYWLRRYVDSALQLHSEPALDHKVPASSRTMTASRTATAYDLRFNFPSIDQGAVDEKDRRRRTESHLNVPPISASDTLPDADPDTEYVHALDALSSFYGGPSANESAKSTMCSSMPNTPNLALSTSITFHQYEQWRQRICIDCALSCVAMVVVTAEVYCAAIGRALCGHYGIDIGSASMPMDEDEAKKSAAYFVIAMGSELWLYGMLYLSMRFCDPKERFNIFQPFCTLYVKAADPFHYALLFVASSWWMLLI